MGLGNDRDDSYHYVAADENSYEARCSNLDTPGMNIEDVVTSRPPNLPDTYIAHECSHELLPIS